MKRPCAALLLVAFNLFVQTTVDAQETKSGRDSCACTSELLRAPVEDTARTQVLILGTPHLRLLKDRFRPSQLDSLISVLAKYKPDLIAVESMSGTLIGELERRGDTYKEVIEQFAKERVANGRAAQKSLGLDRDAAAKKADLLWEDLATKTTPEEVAYARSSLVLALVAAYDINTALLQWSYLPKELQAENKVVPADIAKYLNEQLKLSNEVQAVSIRLARQLGLQRIESVDDYEYADVFASIADQFVKELKASPLYEKAANAALYVDADKAFHLAAKDGNLLPYYLYLNSDDYSAPDIQTQWYFFFRSHLPSGYDRTQVALWEVRNLDIASHIRRATALHPGKRILVTIGAAHRPFLEAYLSQTMDMRIMHLQDFISQEE